MTFERRKHVPVPGPNGHACSRCHLRTEACLLRKFEETKCPVWALMKPGPGLHEEDVAAQPFSLQGYLLASRFKAAVTVDRTEEEDAEAPVVEPNPPPVLAPYRAHTMVRGSKLHVCLACGYLLTAKARRGPENVRCPGARRLKVFVKQALALGVFDVPILEGRAALRALALAQGWEHPDTRVYPLEPD